MNVLVANFDRSGQNVLPIGTTLINADDTEATEPNSVLLRGQGVMEHFGGNRPGLSVAWWTTETN